MHIKAIKSLRREADAACDTVAALLNHPADEIWEEAMNSKERPTSWGGSPEALHFWRKFQELHAAETEEIRRFSNAA